MIDGGLPSIGPQHGKGDGIRTPRAGRPEPPLASPQDGPRSARNPSGHRDRGPLRETIRLRRFFFDDITRGVEPTLPLHYDVLMPSRRAKESALDHLRYRYVDFVCPTATAWHGMLDGPDEQDPVDTQQLMEFFSKAEPRTRIDAYPMYLLMRDLLHRQLNGKMQLQHKEAETLRVENEQLKQQLQNQTERISGLEQELSASGEELRTAELVRKHKQEADEAMKEVRKMSANLNAKRFELAVSRETASHLKTDLEQKQQELVEQQDEHAQWTFVELEAMLSEALDQRGPDDQTLVQAFMLLGEEKSGRLHDRMKRAYPTLFKPRTKYKFIVSGLGKQGEKDAKDVEEEGSGLKRGNARKRRERAEDKEENLKRHLHRGGLTKEEEADILLQLADLEEEKLIQHELEELQCKQQSGNLTAEEREFLHQLEILERDKDRKYIAEQVAAGVITEADAVTQLSSLDDAQDMANGEAKILAMMKSGDLSGKELSQAKLHLENMDHDTKLATTVSKQQSTRNGDSSSIENEVSDMVHQADHLRRRLMDPNLTEAQRKKLSMDLENLEAALEATFQTTMQMNSTDECMALKNRSLDVEKQLRQEGLSEKDKKQLQAELVVLSAAVEGTSRRADTVRSLFKQTVHNVLVQTRSMRSMFSKLNRGKVDHAALETLMQQKEEVLADIHANVERGTDLRAISQAQLAADQAKAEMLSTGLYGADELKTMTASELRESIQDHAERRKALTANAETQTQEHYVGIRKVEECLSKYVEWDKNVELDKNAAMNPTGDKKISHTMEKPKSHPRTKIKKSDKKPTVATDGHSAHGKQDGSLRAPSYHSNALTHAPGIARAKPTSVDDIRERTAKLIYTKIMLDSKMDASMMRRTCMPDFVQENFKNQYGLESIATKHVYSFAAGVLANDKAHQPDRLVQLLGRLAGIAKPEKYSSVEVNFIMDLLDSLFVSTSAGDRLQDALLANLFVDAQLVREKLRLLLTAYTEPWHHEIMQTVEKQVRAGKFKHALLVRATRKRCFAQVACCG